MNSRLKRHTPLKKQSKKQAKRVYSYRLIRKKFLEDKTCALVFADGTRLPGCRITASQVHHPKGRLGKRLLEEELFVPTCDGPCHLYLETHPLESILLGLSLKKLGSYER